MAAKRNIEALRDMLDILEKDAPNLDRYGHLAGSEDLFLTLDERDRRRLIALALILGSEDAQSVACYLMTKLNPEPGTEHELLALMDLTDIQEIHEICAAAKTTARQQLTRQDCARIMEEIRAACEDVGCKNQEEAYWVLIPQDLEEDADWIPAIGGKDDLFSTIGSTVAVGFHPDQSELYDLLNDMRQARWVLHIHNHPNHSSLGFFIPELYVPSSQDLNFASYWKSIRPEIGARMLFFIVSGDVAIEYALPHNQYRQWLINWPQKEQSKLLKILSANPQSARQRYGKIISLSL